MLDLLRFQPSAIRLTLRIEFGAGLLFGAQNGSNKHSKLQKIKRWLDRWTWKNHEHPNVPQRKGKSDTTVNGHKSTFN